MDDPAERKPSTPDAPTAPGAPREGLSFEDVFEAAPDALLVVDTMGQIVLVNDQAVRLFGYARGELLGQPVELLVPERFRAQHPRHRAGYLLRPTPRAMGQRSGLFARRKDGSEFPVEISLKLCQQPGVPHVVVAIRDQTDRKAMEEQLRLAQRMESLGRFAAGVVHDFQNHLAVMATYAQVLKDELASDAPARQVAQEIQSAICRAAETARKILAFSQEQKLDLAVVDIDEFLGGMRGVLLGLLGESIELVLRPGPRRCLVLVDPARFEQVVLNLVTNARDAMPGGGRLTVSIAVGDSATIPEILDSRGDGCPYVVISFADTGLGMDELTRSRIFEPFFSTKKPGNGTGLGLAIAHGIVKQCGGCIAVASQPGQGSVFKVWLPFHAAPRCEHAGELAAPA